MDVSEKHARIWRKDFTRKDGTEFHKYTVGISKKTQDGRWLNSYIPCVFSQKADAPEKIDNGAWCSFKGFMSVGSDKDRDGNTRNFPQIVIMSVEFDDPTTGVDSFERASEDIPF